MNGTRSLSFFEGDRVSIFVFSPTSSHSFPPSHPLFSTGSEREFEDQLDPATRERQNRNGPESGMPSSLQHWHAASTYNLPNLAHDPEAPCPTHQPSTNHPTSTARSLGPYPHTLTND